jgi:hypothetical protein
MMSEENKKPEEIENVEIEPLSDDGLDSVAGGRVAGICAVEGSSDGCPSDGCPSDECPSDGCPSDGAAF